MWKKADVNQNEPVNNLKDFFGERVRILAGDAVSPYTYLFLHCSDSLEWLKRHPSHKRSLSHFSPLLQKDNRDVGE